MSYLVLGVLGFILDLFANGLFLGPIPLNLVDNLFHLVVGGVAVYFGFYAKGGPKGVGDAVNRAVVVTFMLIFFVNFILTALYFAIVPQKFG